MSAGVMDIAANGGTLAPHRHPQAEIYFVHEGAGVLTVDGVRIDLQPGMAVFISGGAEHEVCNGSTSLLRIFYVFPTDSFADVEYRFSPPLRLSPTAAPL